MKSSHDAKHSRIGAKMNVKLHPMMLSTRSAKEVKDILYDYTVTSYTNPPRAEQRCIEIRRIWGIAGVITY